MPRPARGCVVLLALLAGVLLWRRHHRADGAPGLPDPGADALEAVADWPAPQTALGSGATGEVAGEVGTTLVAAVVAGEEAWTDVYAVAATLYRCITGTTPTDAMDRLGGEPLPPPVSFGIDLPAGIDAALLRALEPRQADRTRDIAAFAESLEHVRTTR